MSSKPRIVSRTTGHDALGLNRGPVVVAAAVAALLAFASPPAAAESEPEVKMLQQEVEELSARLGLLEEHVARLEEYLGVAPMPAAVDGGRGPAVERERAGHPLGRSERRFFGPL